MTFNRTLKAEFYTSASITSLRFEERLFFGATWLEADREGRFKWNAATLKNRYFPADDVDIESMGKALEGNELIDFYEVDGKRYAWIPNFKKHQYINNKERDSVLPEPPNKNRIDKIRIDKNRYTLESRVKTPLSRVEELPEFLPKEKWTEFLQHRIDQKSVMSENAQRLGIGVLKKLRDAGHDPVEVINQSILNGWKGLFELNGFRPKKGEDSDFKAQQAADAAWKRRHGES